MSFKLVKLHATGSTNEYLKVRVRESERPELTTVYTDHQTAGKGQMGASWHSEPHKNLTISFLLLNSIQGLSDFEVSKLVSVIVVEWLREKLQIQAVIKWPNDILSVNHKLAGVLIENGYRSGVREFSVIGIGLNVNQVIFPNLKKAISLQNLTGKTYIIDELIIDFLQFLTSKLEDQQGIIARYESYLFKYERTTTFEKGGVQFKAIVKGTDDNGHLLLEQDGELSTYGLKEIKWVY